jgi:hypothetical protein
MSILSGMTPCSLVHTCRYFVINYVTKFRHFWVAYGLNVDFISHRSGNTKKVTEVVTLQSDRNGNTKKVSEMVTLRKAIRHWKQRERSNLRYTSTILIVRVKSNSVNDTAYGVLW